MFVLKTGGLAMPDRSLSSNFFFFAFCKRETLPLLRESARILPWARSCLAWLAGVWWWSEGGWWRPAVPGCCLYSPASPTDLRSWSERPLTGSGRPAASQICPRTAWQTRFQCPAALTFSWEPPACCQACWRESSDLRLLAGSAGWAVCRQDVGRQDWEGRPPWWRPGRCWRWCEWAESWAKCVEAWWRWDWQWWSHCCSLAALSLGNIPRILLSSDWNYILKEFF